MSNQLSEVVTSASFAQEEPYRQTLLLQLYRAVARFAAWLDQPRGSGYQQR
jgi:hypothetical protein